MSMFDEDWRPPKSIDIEGKYRQCCKTKLSMTTQGHISDRCPDEAVWWHPLLSSCLCDHHANQDARNIFRRAWALDRYFYVIEALTQKGCKLNVDL